MTLQNGLVISAKSCSDSADNKNNLRWDLTPALIQEQTERLIQRVRQDFDTIGALDVSKVTIENTLKPLADAKLHYACEYDPLWAFSLHTVQKTNLCPCHVWTLCGQSIKLISRPTVIIILKAH